jgi:pimeloyl-ACP methyl ester carboxylesterase
VKLAVAALLALAALLVANAWVAGDETKGAEVTVPGGRILELPGGDLQVVDRGRDNDRPIVLLHCFTCAIDWWDRMMPLLERRHRVVAIDMLGHGGSEKPTSGYSMENQAEVVAGALTRLGVHDAVLVGHSMGAIVATALGEASPGLVDRMVIVGQAPDNDGYGADLPLTTTLTFAPVVGEALWRVTPDFAVEDGLGIAFRPGFQVPDDFVEDFRRLTYSAYDGSPEAENEYTDAQPLDCRLRPQDVPLLAIFGAEEQIYDSKEALAAYAAIGADTELLPGAGHSPNVEKPAATAALVMRFARSAARKKTGAAGNEKGRPSGRPK